MRDIKYVSVTADIHRGGEGSERRQRDVRHAP